VNNPRDYYVKGARPQVIDSLDSFLVSFLVDKIASLTFVRLISAINMLYVVQYVDHFDHFDHGNNSHALFCLSTKARLKRFLHQSKHSILNGRNRNSDLIIIKKAQRQHNVIICSTK
jgi:hypothetical protein